MKTTNPARKTACIKCWGAGKIHAFDHVASGVCFTCNGSGEMLQKSAAESASAMPVDYDALSSLRRIYRAARSHVSALGFWDWTEGDDEGCSNVRQIAALIAIVDSQSGAKAQAAFVALLGSDFAAELEAQ